MPPIRVVEVVNIIADAFEGIHAAAIGDVIDELAFEACKEALGHSVVPLRVLPGVVPAVAFSAHALGDSASSYGTATVVAGVRAAAVGVKHEGAGRLARSGRSTERLDGEGAIVQSAGGPSDDPSGVQVEDDSEVQPSLQRRDEGDITDPDGIWAWRMKVALEEVVGDWKCVLRVCGRAAKSPLSHGDDAFPPHDARHALLADDPAACLELSMNSGTPIGAPTPCVHSGNINRRSRIGVRS